MDGFTTKIGAKSLFALTALALAGCAAGGGKGLRLASNASYCPSSTVMVCTGLYEPERELAPSCACADLRGAR